MTTKDLIINHLGACGPCSLESICSWVRCQDVLVHTNHEALTVTLFALAELSRDGLVDWYDWPDRALRLTDKVPVLTVVFE